MSTIRFLPFALLCMVLAIVVVGALRRAASTDHEAIVARRDVRLAELRRRLRRGPAVVRSVHRRGMRNRFLFDLGDDEIEAWCFWPPSKPVASVLAVSFRDDIGWILDIDGPAGRGRVYAWLLDVRPVAA